jgi:hypothetical protein
MNRIGTSKTGELINIREWVGSHIPPERPVVFVLGAMAHGKVRQKTICRNLSHKDNLCCFLAIMLFCSV